MTSILCVRSSIYLNLLEKRKLEEFDEEFIENMCFVDVDDFSGLKWMQTPKIIGRAH